MSGHTVDYTNNILENETDDFNLDKIKEQYKTSTVTNKLNNFISGATIRNTNDNTIDTIDITSQAALNQHPITKFLSGIYCNDVVIHYGNRRHSKSGICYLNQFQIINLTEILNDIKTYDYITYSTEMDRKNNYVFKQSFYKNPLRSAHNTQYVTSIGSSLDSQFNLDQYKNFRYRKPQ